jgi:hypothetical protein
MLPNCAPCRVPRFLTSLSLPRSVTFADKIALGQSAVLGIMCVTFPSPTPPSLTFFHTSKSNNLSANQYNWLGTIFYLSYLVFEYPQNLALQRWPVGKWMRFAKSQLVRSKLILDQASISSSGQSHCCVMPPARISVVCLPSASSLECARAQSPQGS